MRVVAKVPEEKQAVALCGSLQANAIEAVFEKSDSSYLIWIVNEDDMPKAEAICADFQKNPLEVGKISQDKIAAMHMPDSTMPRPVIRKKMQAFPLTYFLLMLCIGLFMMSSLEKKQVVNAQGAYSYDVGLTPLVRDLLYDFPQAFTARRALVERFDLTSEEGIKQLTSQQQQALDQVQKIPYWQGLYYILLDSKKVSFSQAFSAPMFEKIKEGQVYRLITPAVLHGSLLHILFNMLWLYVLVRQVEWKIGFLRALFLMTLIGVISNTMQYLMSGPVFLGFSGIVCGLVGFIWMRQKIAPWEGYPLPKQVVSFVLIFILGIMFLDLIAFFLKFSSALHLYAGFANTAHISGAIAGMALARIPLFSRSERS